MQTKMHFILQWLYVWVPYEKWNKTLLVLAEY